MEDSGPVSPPKPDELWALYRREIEPWLKTHEATRRVVILQTILVAALALVTAGVWLWFAELRSLDPRLAAAGFKAILLLGFIATILVRARLRSELKNLIVGKLVRLHGFTFLGWQPKKWLQP